MTHLVCYTHPDGYTFGHTFVKCYKDDNLPIPNGRNTGYDRSFVAVLKAPQRANDLEQLRGEMYFDRLFVAVPEAPQRANDSEQL